MVLDPFRQALNAKCRPLFKAGHGLAQARRRQVSGVVKYFSNINFKNDVANEKKIIVCFIIL
jgi:hypothetical protein